MSENINELYNKIDFLVNGGALKSLTDFLQTILPRTRREPWAGREEDLPATRKGLPSAETGSEIMSEFYLHFGEWSI